MTNGLYFSIFIVIILIAYAGIDETLKLFSYFDLRLKYFFIQIKMKQMQRKIEKELKLPAKDWENYLKNDKF